MKIRRRAGVSPGPVALNGPVTVSCPDMGAARPVERVERALEKRTELRGIHRRGTADERSDDIVRAGPDTDANGKALIDRVGRFFRQRECGAQIRGAADRRVMHTLAIQRELELVRVLDAPRVVEVGPEQPGLNDVLAVTREEMGDARSPERAERHPIEVLILRHVAAHVIGVAQRARFGVADR